MFSHKGWKICSALIWALLYGLLRAADGQDLKPFRISLSLGSAQLPLWAARDAGLFAKYGLNAELLGLQSASRQVQLILAGDTLGRKSFGNHARQSAD